jgi:hypothetical protein
VSLFELANITLHSGRESFFKIECDALTGADWQAAGGMLARILPPFCGVLGVPRGGIRLMKALVPYQQWGAHRSLIVDDVWTTGASMEEFREAKQDRLSPEVIGAVLFARGPVADWVTPLFTLHEGLWAA